MIEQAFNPFECVASSKGSNAAIILFLIVLLIGIGVYIFKNDLFQEIKDTLLQ